MEKPARLFSLFGNLNYGGRATAGKPPRGNASDAEYAKDRRPDANPLSGLLAHHDGMRAGVDQVGIRAQVRY